jgi:hypothetical protein
MPIAKHRLAKQGGFDALSMCVRGNVTGGRSMLVTLGQWVIALVGLMPGSLWVVDPLPTRSAQGPAWLRPHLSSGRASQRRGRLVLST